MPLPLYQGPQVESASATNVSTPVETPFAATFQRSAAASTNALLSLEQAVQDRQEYTLEQKRSAAIQDAAHNLDMELIRRSQLPDGHPDSLYDEDGILIKSQVDEIRSRYLSVADSWTSGFTSEQGMRSASEAQFKYRSSVNQAIDAKLLAGLKSRATNALSDNIQASYTRGDYDTADTAVDNAYERGIISESESIIIKDKNNVARHTANLQAMDDPMAIEAALNDPANAEFFDAHPAIANDYSRKIDILLEYQGTPAYVEEETIVATTADEQGQASTSGTSSRKRIVPAQAPVASPGYVQAHFRKYGADLDSWEAQEAGFAILNRVVNSKRQDELKDPHTVFAIKRLAKTLHIDEDTANNLIKTRIEATNAPMPEFNTAKAAQSLRDSYEANKKTRNIKAFSNPDGTINAIEKTKWGYQFALQDAAIGAIIQGAERDMEVWLKANPDSNPVQQARQFQGFLNYRKNQWPIVVRNEEHAWAHLDLGLLQLEWSTSENTAATMEHQDKKKRDAAQQTLDLESKRYEKLKQEEDIINEYYTYGISGMVKRRMTDRALIYQAANVTFNDNVAPLSSAVNLPGTNTELVIYRPIDTEKTGSISRVDSVIVQQGGDTFLVKIVDNPDVSAPVPSVLLQKKLKLIGKKNPTRVYFRDNVLTFTRVTPPKKSKGKSHRNQPQATTQQEESSEQQTYEDNPNLLFASDDYVIDEYGTVHYVGDGLYDHHETYVDGNLPF